MNDLRQILIKNIIPFIMLIIVIIIVIIDLWLHKRPGRNLSKILTQERTSLGNIREQIIDLLIKHRDKMSRVEICNYFDLPMELVARELREMEKEGIISRIGLKEDFVGLDGNWRRRNSG